VTTTPEDRVRTLLHTAVQDVAPTGDGWADVENRARRAAASGPRRLRMALAVAAASAVLLGALAVVARLGDDDGGTRVITPAHPTTAPAPSPTPSPSTAPTTVRSTLPDGAPSTLVGTRDHSTKLVIADAATGATHAVLADLGPYRADPGAESTASNIIESLALSPDGQYAYFSTGPEPAYGSLHRVPLAGGKVEDLGDGAMPAISTDGKRLAFARGQELLVRDLVRGGDRTFTNPTVQGLIDPVWTKDGKAIVVYLTTDSASGWYSVDASLDGRFTPLSPPDAHWQSPSVRGYDGLVGFVDGQSFIVVEPATGAVKGRTPLTAQVLHADYDATGRHQVLIGQGGKLYRRSGGALTPVATNYDLAVW
jgi:hypothetical protein